MEITFCKERILVFQVWDTQEYAAVVKLTGHTGLINSLACMQTANGNRIFSASQDRSVRVRCSAAQSRRLPLGNLPFVLTGVAFGSTQHLHASPRAASGRGSNSGRFQRASVLRFRRQHRQSLGALRHHVSDRHCGLHIKLPAVIQRCS